MDVHWLVYIPLSLLNPSLLIFLPITCCCGIAQVETMVHEYFSIHDPVSFSLLLLLGSQFVHNRESILFFSTSSQRQDQQWKTKQDHTRDGTSGLVTSQERSRIVIMSLEPCHVNQFLAPISFVNVTSAVAEGRQYL